MKRTCLGIALICITLFTGSCGKSASQTETETPVNTTSTLSEEEDGQDKEQSLEGDTADSRPDQEQKAADSSDDRPEDEQLAEDSSDTGSGSGSRTEASSGGNSSVYDILSEKASELENEYGSMSEDHFSYVDVDYDDFMNGQVPLEDRKYDEGLLLTDIYDYDHDNVPELLSIRRETGTIEEDKEYGLVEKNRSEYTLEMYEAVQDECRLADSIMVGVFDILNWSTGDTAMLVYRHEMDSHTNICIATTIGQQDNPAGSSLIEIRYDEETFSLTDGVKYGWFTCLEPASEQAIEYLSVFGTSPDYFWDAIIPSDRTDENHVRVVEACQKKLKEMGFRFTHSSDETAQTYDESESEPDSQDINSEDDPIKSGDSYTPLDGTLNLMASLSSEADYSEFMETEKVGLYYTVDIYVGPEDTDSDNESNGNENAGDGDENTGDTEDGNAVDTGEENTVDTVDGNTEDTGVANTVDNGDENTLDNEEMELLEPYLGDGWYSNSMTSDENGYPVPAFTAEIYDSYIEIQDFEGTSYRKEISAVVRDGDGVLIKLENGEAYFGPDEDPNALWFYFDWERGADNMSGSDSLSRSE